MSFTPALPFPLAGMVTARERLAAWVRDPLNVTVIALESSNEKIALVCLDLLIVESRLFDSIDGLARARGFSCAWAAASHTHSSMGGYVDSAGGRFFMGGFRPRLLEHLLETVDRCLSASLESLDQVREIDSGTSEVSGLTMNRRSVEGPTDDEIRVLRLGRARGKPILLVNLPGHPVAIGMRRPEAASADIPGGLGARLLDSGFLPMVVPGALGGLNLLFPELHVPVESHIDLVTGLAEGGVRAALAGAVRTSDRTLGRCFSSLSFQRSFPPTSGGPLREAFTSVAASALGYAYSRFTTPDQVDVSSGVVRIGPLALAGMPADFGVAATLALKDRLRVAGAPLSMVTSHTNGYVGYLHLPHETRWTPHSRAEFLHYENAMNWFGIDSTDRLMEHAENAARTLFG